MKSGLDPLPDESRIRWRRVDVRDSEEARIVRTAEGWRLTGRVEVEEVGAQAPLAYVVDCRPDW